jgi:membrane-associated phospholipid phosphatase
MTAPVLRSAEAGWAGPLWWRAGRRICEACAAFAGVIIIASQAAGHGVLEDTDRAAFAAVRSRRRPAGVVAARWVSALAEPRLAYPAAVLAGIGAGRRTNWWRACGPVLVLGTGAAARRRVSRVIARPRPPAAAWLTDPEGFSLPSKHTTMAALTAGACVRAAGGRGRGYVPSVLAAAAVGASRVYLGVHWPGDVLAGWLFAVGWLRLTDPG